MQNHSSPGFEPPGIAPPPPAGIAPPPHLQPPYPEVPLRPPPTLIPDNPLPTPQPILGPNPTVTICPQCAVRITTRTEDESSGCCGCFSCSDSSVRHYCTNCNAFLGTYNS